MNDPTLKTLRQQAEKLALKNKSRLLSSLEPPSPEKTRQLLHELRVHQIELEMQNEELRRTQQELEATRARYFNLYDVAPVGYCTLNDSGKIVEANYTAAALLGVDRGTLTMQPMTRLIFKEDQDTYYLLRKKLLKVGDVQTCELRLLRNRSTPFWSHLTVGIAPGSDGRPSVRVILSDVSERVLLQTQSESTQKM